jgi:phosphoglycolate phosphatase-like HAD superfamily hydrolase/ADP-ribose pyrophosphatase YjhB (NUDIX family)
MVIRNIIFDWSGTLVDDLPAVWQATNYVFRQAGIPELSLDQFRAEFCLPFTKFYERYVAQVPLAQLEEWFHERYKQVQDAVIEMPYAREFLERCRERGVRMFVLSSVHRDHWAAQTALTGFAPFFEQPYIEVWDKRSKILDILQEHQLRPEETLFIGDMQHDIETARHGGVRACAVLTGYNRLEQLRASQPDLIVEHLGELRELLDREGWDLRPGVEREPARAVRVPIVTVGALIFNDHEEVLMIRTHKWSDLWGIPGGKVRYGETLVDALRREVKEETNLHISGIDFVMVQECIYSPEFYRREHFLLVNYTCHSAGHDPVKLNAEAKEFRWVTLLRAQQMPLNQPTRKLVDVVMNRDERGALSAALSMLQRGRTD